ncbi:hypothetical protein Gpo141_00011110 [Globisporangium polare]
MESSNETAPTANDAAATATQQQNQQPQQQPQQQQQQSQQPQQQQQVFLTQPAGAAVNSTPSVAPTTMQAPSVPKGGARGGAAAGGEGAVGKKGKAVAPRKNAKNSDPTGIGMPKKPSPRARTPKAAKAAADGGENGAGKKKMTAAEKKKTTALVAAQSVTQATSSAPPTSSVPEKHEARAGEPPVATGNTQDSEKSELLPMYDNELRKAYLQQM